MKEGTIISKAVIILFAAGLAAWFGISVWRGMTDPLATVVAYAYTVNDSVEAEGLLVRQEKVLPARTGIADVTPGEGERVGAGQTVATFYRDAQTLEDRRTVEQLSMEAELLEYAMGLTETEIGTAELEDGVVSGVVELRAAAAARQFDRLETQVLDLKRAVLKRDYVYGQKADTGRLNQLKSRIRTLRAGSEQNISRTTAPEAGVFSAQVDGYESILTMKTAGELTAAQVLELMEREEAAEQSALGKLITSNRWGFLTVLTEEQSGRLTAGKTILARFTGDFSKDVEMRVDAVGEAENGRCAVLLSSDRYLSETTLLRRQTAELIFESDTGLRVPKSCVHILTKTHTDEKTGQTTQERVTGVYALVGSRAAFRKVRVLAEGTQFYVVKPLAEEGEIALRPGDEIILRAKELSNGKIVQE